MNGAFQGVETATTPAGSWRTRVALAAGQGAGRLGQALDGEVGEEADVARAARQDAQRASPPAASRCRPSRRPRGRARPRRSRRRSATGAACRPSGPSAAHAGKAARAAATAASTSARPPAATSARRRSQLSGRAHLEGPPAGAGHALAADEVVGRDGDALDGGRAAGGRRAAHGRPSSWASRTTRRSRRARVARSSGSRPAREGGLARVELREERLDEPLAVVGQGQAAQPPVGLVALAAHEAPALERVRDAGDRRAGDARRVRQRADLPRSPDPDREERREAGPAQVVAAQDGPLEVRADALGGAEDVGADRHRREVDGEVADAREDVGLGGDERVGLGGAGAGRVVGRALDGHDRRR